MFLVDTNVLSADAPGRSVIFQALLEWMDENSSRLYVSTITIMELEDGIAKSRRDGASRKAARLSEWLDAVIYLYDDRILPFDLAAARLGGALFDFARGKGLQPGFADLAIAATAQARGLTILTGNFRHFAPLGMAVHDPFQSGPPV